jgi:hypothetical protein
MNSRAIIVLTVLLVFGWAGAALAGETCNKFPPAGNNLIIVTTEDQLGEAIGDPEALAADDPTFPTASPGDFVCIAADITLTVAGTGADGANITVNNIVIYSATKADGTGFTVTGSGAGNPVFVFGHMADADGGDVNTVGSTLGDPLTIDCAGGTVGVEILPGSNRSTVIDNRIGGITGACTVAGVLVRADFDTDGDQDQDDTDGDGILENTRGVRVAANTFDPVAGGVYGPAIIVQEGVLGVADADNLPAGTTATSAWDQCAGTYDAFFRSTSNHTVIGTTTATANAAAGAAGNGPGLDDGNTINTGAGGEWAEAGGFGAIDNSGANICIQGNLVRGAGVAFVSGIYLAPASQGTVVKGNSVGGWANHGIEVQGPFKSEPPARTGDSVHANLVGSASAGGGNGRDGIFCDDREGLYWLNTSNGNSDDGIDMGDLAEAEANDDGGCTKRAAVFGNTANSNGGNGIVGGTEFIDNTANNNGGDGINTDNSTNPSGHSFCGNIANNNGDDGYDVRDGNQFLKALTVGNATCARGNQTIISWSESTYTGSNFADSNGSDGVEARDNNTFENSVSTRNTGNGFNVRDNNTFRADPNFADCNTVDGFLGDDGNTFNAVIARSNTSSGIHVTGGLNRIFNSLAGSLPATGALCATVQANGLEVDGGGPNTSNRAWDNVFGAGTRRNGSGGFATETAARGNGNGIQIDAGVLRLNEGQDAADPTGLPTVQVDLDGDGRNFEACNTMASNTSLGVFLTAAAVNGNLQVLDDEDGAGGSWLGNIYEQAGSASGANPNDIENDSGETVKMEGLWTLVTVGPTPDIFVDGDSSSTVQVSSPRNGGATTVDGLYANCAGSSSNHNHRASSSAMSTETAASMETIPPRCSHALRNRAPWLTDPTDPKFKVSDVARPCGKITRADYNRLRSSWLRVQKGRSALKSQCGSKGIIGQAPPASASRLLTVLSGQAGAAGVRVAVYDFAGRLLLEQKATGAQVALDLVQRELANGVYLAVVESLAADGRTLVREVRKVIVLR